MVRTATHQDLSLIIDIKNRAITAMYTNGIDQWNDTYPTQAHFEADITKGDLYVVEHNGEVAGFSCINTDLSPEYDALSWSNPTPCYSIHRLAIDPSLPKLGLASELMAFAETLARSNNHHGMRIDTFSKNTLAQSLFKKHGYTYVGDVFFDRRPEPFYCYEKTLIS